MKNVNAYTGPQRFAHRGLVQAAPENTLGAFQGAVDGGYEGIEIDVQMTRDGEIVIAHDSNFTRMTLGHPDGGSNRRIRDLTWDEIQKIELPYANHLLSEVPPEHSEIQLLAMLPKLVMGQVEGRDYETALAEDGRMAHLMRFSDFDAWLTAQSRSITVEVEVKAPGLAGPILELLSRSPNTGSYILFSGDPVYVEEMQAAGLPEDKTEETAEEKTQEEPKEMGFISVSIGEGINEIFRGLGVDYIIEGGQTMNPSTEDMLTAIDHVNADYIYILPNNKNIVMAANQARDLTEDKEIIVVPSKNIPQGIAAIINFMPDMSGEENLKNMCAEMENVSTGQVTYAVRDTEIDGKTIKENDIMGIGDKTILAVGSKIEDTTLEMVAEMMKETDAELLSVYYGEDIKEAEAEGLQKALEEAYPDCDVELQYGGQPIYYYVISAE